jgi:hypothetical protein
MFGAIFDLHQRNRPIYLSDISISFEDGILETYGFSSALEVVERMAKEGYLSIRNPGMRINAKESLYSIKRLQKPFRVPVEYVKMILELFLFIFQKHDAKAVELSFLASSLVLAY